MGFGLFGFLLFGLAELFRMSLALNAVNAWRRAYGAESDEAVRAMLRGHLAVWPQIGTALFFLLILGFFIGNLGFGIATWKGRGLERVVSFALLVWSAISLAVIVGEFGGPVWIAPPEWVSITYQPAVRVLIALWLWRLAAASDGQLSGAAPIR